LHLYGQITDEQIAAMRDPKLVGTPPDVQLEDLDRFCEGGNLGLRDTRTTGAAQ
jgi:hypothetical protein